MNSESAPSTPDSEPRKDSADPWEKAPDPWAALRASAAKAIKFVRRVPPRELASWSPAVTARLDADPEEASYAIFVWRREAESRSFDGEPVVDVGYFSGLTKTLTVYGDHVGVAVPSLMEFARRTTTGEFDELRRPYDSSVDPVYLRAEDELVRLSAAISQRLAAIAESEAAERNEFGSLTPLPNQLERAIVQKVREMDRTRKDNPELKTTGDQIALAINRKVTSGFKGTLAILVRFCVLAQIPKSRGYCLGPLADWFCPDSSPEKSGPTQS